MDEPESTVWEVGERFQGWRLDRFLVEMIPKLSRSRIQKVIGERIRLSWTKDVSPSTRLRSQGKVFADFPRLFEVPADYEFRNLFEDENILAIDKPAGLVVHPTNSCRSNSLIEIIRRVRKDEKLTLVHRLDRETSGVLVLAKSPIVARNWARALEQRLLKKTYLARVHGVLAENEGAINQPIGRAVSSRVHVRRIACEGGVRAVTRFKRIETDGATTLLELVPETGRTHQLRVHCEWMGHPILGDPLYGRPDEHYLQYVKGEVERVRLYLHAIRLAGTVGGIEYSIDSPLPEEFGPHLA